MYGPSYILLPKGGNYCWGVEAGSGLGVELHGGFKTREAAITYGMKLRREFSDYEYIVVVKIETPNVGSPILSSKAPA